jgi:hypothetical protein
MWQRLPQGLPSVAVIAGAVRMAAVRGKAKALAEHLAGLRFV